MKKSKIILLYSLLILSSLYICYIIVTDNYITKYNIKDQLIEGIITNYKIDGNIVKLEVKAKEKIIVNYYIKTIEEKKHLEKNIKLGDKYKIQGVFKIPEENRNFNLFNYNRYLKSKKIYWIMTSSKMDKIKENSNILYEIKNNIIKKINNQNNSAYLNLFIIGDNSLMDNNTLDKFRNIGISHLFAISGMHITLLCSIILKFLNKITKKQLTIFVIIFIFLNFYIFLANYSPSIIRASYLFIILFFKKISKKLNKIKTIYILILILLIMLIYNPYYIYNIGFVFSFLVSFTLIIIQKSLNSFNTYYKQIFITSIVSFLISMPISINNFFEINLLTPIINLIFIPYVSLFLFPLSLITFIIPYFNKILVIAIKILEIVIDITNKIDIFIITVPKLSFIIVVLLYIIIIYVIKKIINKKYQYLFIILILILIMSNKNYLNFHSSITLIDVGQGDSILIELKHNKGNILIDTGGMLKYNEKWEEKKNSFNLAKTTIIPYLKSVGIKKLNYLIITHGDMDHIEYTNYLYQNFNIKNVIFNSGNDNFIEKEIIKDIKVIKMSTGKININDTVLNLINEKDITNENEDSLVIYTNINNKNILLMGDAGFKTENKLLNVYNFKKMDILKVGHHGSKYSTSAKFLKTIKPKYALISAGVNNRFNHPNKETIELLKKENIKIFETNKQGMIKIILKDKLIIKTAIHKYANSF